MVRILESVVSEGLNKMKYKNELNQLVAIANNTLMYQNPPYKIELEHYNGYAIILRDSFDNTIKLSPRMSIKNLCNWLNGFISGLEF